MKLVAAAATIGAHATVLVALGALNVETPARERSLELTTVTLVDLPVPEPEPVPEPDPEPEPEPEPAPEPPVEVDSPPPEPPPAPRPKPPAQPAQPTRPDVPLDPPAGPDPAVPVPGDAAASDAPVGSGPNSPEEAPPGPRRRKLSGELTNARPKRDAQRGPACKEAPVRPKIRSRVDPTFPKAARAGGVEGELSLVAHVAATGVVSRVTVAHGLDPSVDEPAKAALLQWTFEPATRCGKPVPSKVRRGWRFAPKD